MWVKVYVCVGGWALVCLCRTAHGFPCPVPEVFHKHLAHLVPDKHGDKDDEGEGDEKVVHVAREHSGKVLAAPAHIAETPLIIVDGYAHGNQNNCRTEEISHMR